MNKILQRLLMFAVGLPAIVTLVILLPYHHHLVVNLTVVVFSALGAVEFSDILGKKIYAFQRSEAAILGALTPAAMTLSVSFGIGGELVPAAVILGAMWLITSRTFSSPSGLSDSVSRIAAGLAVMVYPGLFMVWIIRMALFPRAEVIILVFLLIVFANDSLAWAVGMLFGKGNRGVIPASPNKSIAGFLGGLAASVAVGALAAFYFPPVFSRGPLPVLVSGAVLGLVTGVVAIIGDLAESTLKRSVALKDSGNIIPGRGGILDSIDSISLAAPVFYALYWILF